MGNTEKPEVTVEEVQKAENLWVGFTYLLKYGTIATIGGLVLLAIFLL